MKRTRARKGERDEEEYLPSCIPLVEPGQGSRLREAGDELASCTAQ